MNSYIVKEGETISDVVYNATGNIKYWNSILSANNFTDWIPDLSIGQVILIPDSITIDQNTVRQLSAYPACNNSVPDIIDKINNLAQLMSDNWILSTGFWNDNAIWNDSKTWIDSL